MKLLILLMSIRKVEKNNMKVHCFFEQSGTFKNEFLKLGINAYDYDILNDFGETDFVIDLFKEIDKAYEGNDSIFDNINNNDLIIAFFPCIRFEVQSIMLFKGTHHGINKMSLSEKLVKHIEYHNELNNLMVRLDKLVLVCLKMKIKLIIENPYQSQHYLNRYWCVEPALIEEDRQKNGDWFKKPTQYYFINCEPQLNLLFDEPIVYRFVERVDLCNKVYRSLISPDYARRFIRMYVLGV